MRFWSLLTRRKSQQEHRAKPFKKPVPVRELRRMEEPAGRGLVPKTGTIPAALVNSLAAFKEQFKHAQDFVAREITIGVPPGTDAALLFIEGLAKKMEISENILENAMLLGRMALPPVAGTGEELLDLLEKRYLSFAQTTRTTRFEDAVIALLQGDSILLVDGAPAALRFDTKGWEHRAVGEPETEAVIRGPRDGFIEVMRVNVAHIRRRLRTPDLAVKQMRMGRRTQTDVSILYLVDVADNHVVEEVQRRLTGIDIDSVLESGYVSMLISDDVLSPFPLVERTERPDKVAASILEGRVAIVVDNSPFVLIVPTSFWTFFQASEDYYENPYLSTFLRLLRLAALAFTTFGTAVYVALSTFHQEVIPFALLLRIVGTHEGIPFPTLPTAIILELVIEVLREAGIRLPSPIGQAVSIVGAIIIGEAAVSAGFAPPGMVIIVAFATIASFTIPGYNMSIPLRLLRFIMLFAAGTLGLFGLGAAAMVMLIHIMGLKSFGYPYLSLYDVGTMHEMKDKIITTPVQFRSVTRPRWSEKNRVRQSATAGKPPAPRERMPRRPESTTESEKGDDGNQGPDAAGRPSEN